jgi:hypothetical protein
MQEEALNEELEVELPGPMDEQSEPEAEAKEQDAAPQEKDDELENYSESVKRRISKLTNRFREEERQRQAALEFAEAVKKQNDELKQRLERLDESYVGEFGTRLESQAAAAKEEYRKAYEDGDADKMFEAQEKISRLALEKSRYEDAKSKQAARETVEQEMPQAPIQQPQQQAQPDPKAESWAETNKWFGTDQTMTYAAFGIHRQLVEEEGFDPTSDEYYTEIDNRIRTEFPHKFENKEQPRDPGPRVASAESTASKSSSPKGRRTVKLSPSQIAIAKRLNVPLEEYAKYVKE